MKQFIFLSGVPRSGSQVLSSLMNQHPSITASTTSPLADLLINVGEVWPVISQAMIDRDINQYSNMVRGLMHGAYEHIDKPIIVDKNRLWPRLIKEIKPALGHKPKIIFTVRSIPEILSSYILLIRKSPNKVSFVDQELINASMIVNDKNRCKMLWERFVQHPYTSVKIGLNSNDCEKLVLDYSEIVNDSQKTFDRICDFISVDRFIVDLDNLQQMEENDKYHGGLDGLHEVRKVMQRTSPNPEEVIGHELTKFYTDVNAEFWKKYINQRDAL